MTMGGDMVRTFFCGERYGFDLGLDFFPGSLKVGFSRVGMKPIRLPTHHFVTRNNKPDASSRPDGWKHHIFQNRAIFHLSQLCELVHFCLKDQISRRASFDLKVARLVKVMQRAVQLLAMQTYKQHRALGLFVNIHSTQVIKIQNYSITF